MSRIVLLVYSETCLSEATPAAVKWFSQREACLAGRQAYKNSRPRGLVHLLGSLSRMSRIVILVYSETCLSESEISHVEFEAQTFREECVQQGQYLVTLREEAQSEHWRILGNAEA